MTGDHGTAFTDRDAEYMRRALVLAQRGRGWTSPNPMVGCVVVRDGAIVGEGWHARYGGPHAEVNALAAAGERARGATVYVTLEPCAHTGKTPPCVDALVAADVARVVYAVADPNPAAGGGATRLRNAGIVVEQGLVADSAREQLAAFLWAQRADRPWVTLKLAVSLDGAIAAAKGSSTWLTGPESRRFVHRLRATNDAIAVGIGTVLADDPRLTVRDVRAPRIPLRRVVFDRRARLPLDSDLVRSVGDAPVTVIATTTPADADGASRRSALRNAGVDVIAADDLASALRALKRNSVQSLLVEGGAELAGAMLSEGLIDRLVILEAPVLLGAGSIGAFSHLPSYAEDPRRLRVVERRMLGPDLMSTYAITEL